MEYFQSSSSSKAIHVYLSFRGDDDTYKFVEGLSSALEREGLGTFGDDKKLETGDSDIPPHLLEAIEQSWVCIVVFSKNYASSPWCLQEISEVAARSHSRRYIIIPVFFDIYPSYEESFYEHEERFKADLDQVLRWRQAVNEVANLSGLHLRNYSGSQMIQVIVREVKTKIDQIFYRNFNFVGMQSRVKKLENLLDLGSNNEVRVIGICGIPGSGKTSLARVLYDKVFHYFDAFCFIADVREHFIRNHNLSLQELLCENLKAENSMMRDILGKDFIACKRLRHHKCLIVLDDVDRIQHLEELNFAECFGGGSRIIIITCRDMHLLQIIGAHDIFEIGLLTEDESLQLFCSRAFQSESPMSGFEEMTYRIVDSTGGLPLAIIVLGSFLSGRSFEEWIDTLDHLKRIPQDYISYKLKISYDVLDYMCKEMFLDIACFFKTKDTNHVKEILHDCGFPVEMGFKHLLEKSFITILNQRIHIHDLLKEMGREIIRQKNSADPGKRSRLWFYYDILHVMEKDPNKALKDIEAIVLDLDKAPGEETLRLEALSHMINLRLLIFHNVNCAGTLNNLSNKLRYVSWHQYPLPHLPSSFKSDVLVQLIMPNSNITEVWKGKMMLPKLRNMKLCGSKRLIRTPDFSGVPNLEKLDVEGCIGLLQLHSSIAQLSKLKFLNLKNCMNLVSIPNRLFAPNSLKILDLTHCPELAYCLNFSPLRSSIEVKLLSILYCPLLEKMLYSLLYALPRQRNYAEFVFCCIFYLIWISKI